MRDKDLAKLYGVETKVLNLAVRRNITRFPDDFMIQADSKELVELRSQFVTLDEINNWNRKHPLFKVVFERLDNLEDQSASKLSPNRKKIGLNPK